MSLGIRLVGIVSSQDLSRDGWTVVDIMTPRPTCVEPTLEVAKAAAKMASMKISCMPVVTHGRLVGIVTSFDLLTALSSQTSEHTDEAITVQTVLTPDPIVVSPDSLVSDAAALMTENEFRHLPVVKDERLVGILSTKDIRPGDALRVDEVMTSDPATINAQQPIELAATMMAGKKVSCLLVTTQGDLTES